MDYKYIEQLLERYFDCQTTLQEEQILRSFFAQEDVPASLLQYAELFQYETEEQSISLGEDFDARMLALVAEQEEQHTAPAAKVVKMQRNRFAPFFRAAAVVAIVLTVGDAADRAISDDHAVTTEGITNVNPYIKQADIHSTFHIKDVSQAENRPKADSSLIKDQVEENIQ